MRNGFNASVPARKPKTQIGRVLTELTSQSRETATEVLEEDLDLVPEEPGAAATETVAGAPADQTAPPPPPPSRAGPEPGENSHPAQESPAAMLRVGTGQDRLAALRKRLALAAQPRSTKSDAKHTAAAVRELVEELRGRLEATVTERSEIAGQLEETRAALARAETELERERRARTAVDAQAEERGQVADEAVAEAEALAAERDLVLGELAERRRLDHEQATLLAEAEAVLDQHGAEREAAARELAEARDLLDLRIAEIADLETRLQTEAAERAKVEARCRELEAEVARLAEATEALDAIQAMVGPRK